MRRAEIEAGLKSHDRALFVKEGWIRDPYIVLSRTDLLPDRDHAAGRDPASRRDPYNTGPGRASHGGLEGPGLAEPGPGRLGVARHAVYAQRRDLVLAKSPKRFHEVDPKSQWRLWAPELHWLGDRWALVHTSPAPVKGANLSLTHRPRGGRALGVPDGRGSGGATIRRSSRTTTARGGWSGARRRSLR